MVIFREIDRPPVSLILPHVYLGAESDVTQDCLSSQGISYVLSVSRCCPQPDYLPQSQYLRIPINDSLRDELLPWIPEALQFIDGAISLGCSVLIHCAAGVSRSPALAVAYVMYQLGLDLDDAYRFVKERRPSISPNFNFLGQLQYFQGTLALKDPTTKQNAQLFQVPDKSCSTNEDVCCSPALLISTNQDALILDVPKDNCDSKDCTKEIKQCKHCNNFNQINDHLNQGYFECVEISQAHFVTRKPNQEKPNENEFTLSLSDRLQALTLSLDQTEMQSSSNVLIQNQNSFKNVQPKPHPKPTEVKILPGSASLSDRRKTLTLSLSPMETDPPTHRKKSSGNACMKNCHQKDQTNIDCNSKIIQKWEVTQFRNSKTLNKMLSTNDLTILFEKSKRETTKPCDQKREQNWEGKSNGNSKTLNKVERDSCYNSKLQESRESDHSNANHEQGGESWCRSTAQSQTKKGGFNSTDKAPDGHCASAVEAVESVDLKQITLSPLNLTVNKMLSWGEKILLGALLGPRIKVGHAVLPYKC